MRLQIREAEPGAAVKRQYAAKKSYSRRFGSPCLPNTVGQTLKLELGGPKTALGAHANIGACSLDGCDNARCVVAIPAYDNANIERNNRLNPYKIVNVAKIVVTNFLWILW